MYDLSIIRDRIAMRDLFERAGVSGVRRAPNGFVCLCPFHVETTASCHVNEEKRFFKCFGCGQAGDAFTFWGLIRQLPFAQTAEELARIAGVSAGSADYAVMARPKRIAEEQTWFPAELDATAKARWEEGVQALAGSEEQIWTLAEWRGYRLEFVRWLIGMKLIGVMPYYGILRTALAVMAPLPGRVPMPQVGVHIRLKPYTEGNPTGKQSWRYVPARTAETPHGVGAWPFVLGNPAKADMWFVAEGQWDACALADLMEWEKSWPPRVCVIGLRGSTSWKLMLRAYPVRPEITVFAVADRDEAGAAWWKPGGFLEQLEPRVGRVFGFWARAEACKDFNDLTRAQLVGKQEVQAFFLRKIAPHRNRQRGGKSRSRESFLGWCRLRSGEAGREGELCALVAETKGNPPVSSSLRIWMRHWICQGLSEERVEALRKLYLHWRQSI
jgi:hypothetical protein